MGRDRQTGGTANWIEAVINGGMTVRLAACHNKVYMKFVYMNQLHGCAVLKIPFQYLIHHHIE